jgi:hypothetical protein
MIDGSRASLVGQVAQRSPARTEFRGSDRGQTTPVAIPPSIWNLAWLVGKLVFFGAWINAPDTVSRRRGPLFREYDGGRVSRRQFHG